jgi:hypothetical protein
MDSEHAFELLERKIRERRGLKEASIADQSGQSTQRLACLGN